MNNENASSCLSELGNPTRLAIFRLLVRAGENGVIVGDIARHLDAIPGSTLSHHLAHLTRAGLIEQRRDGRQLWCIARHDVMDNLIEFLTHECCAGLPVLDEENEKRETAA
ncbi:MAG: helix-turn-helix transcriptional regulator [Rhodospirillales bacterium]|jgi:ArsR family transcriptional regulator, arsenate/arsenite/antimonite-responsive transcriptional repressor|nr:helix-turn-helix transcriptional regulator [Rhodospirillales bacterium]